ncbi:MAG: hypothetical protein N2254_05110, partial [bacterium]|nr:hypothetical protein [bacterium]
QAIEEGIEQGRKEGIEKGRKEGIEKGLKDAIESILIVKFGRRDKKLLAKIKKIKDLELLRKIKTEAMRTKSFNEFIKKIEKLKI